jgi:hypothetical protein
MRAGAHRSGSGLVGALVPSALAVAAVTALITALAVWQGEEPDQPSAAASTTSATAATTRAEATTAPPSPSASPTPTATPSKTKKASPTAEPTTPVARDLEIVVLNQTTRSGLASTVADRLRAAGWEVPAVGNFRGVVPSTTVYYPPGGEAEALAVANDLPTEPRTRPRFGNLSTTRLTVVVTSSYPG